MDQPQSFVPNGDNAHRIARIREFASEYSPDIPHDEQVKKNALQIFDQLASLHGQRDQCRFVLEAGSLLHDIGWSQGVSAHHKSGSRLVMQDRSLPISDYERLFISLLVRYHRKAHPSLDHRDYSRLHPADRKRVRVLASIIRIADGLDRTHQSLLDHIAISTNQNQITFHCKGRGEGKPEVEYAMKKSDLFSLVFGVEVAIKWYVIV